MIASRRWQDWAVTVFGVLVAASPLAFTNTWSDPTAFTAYTMGALIVLAGVFELLMPRAVYFEWTEIVLAIVLFFTPWLIGFTGVLGMAITAWLAAIGIVIVVGSVFVAEGEPKARVSAT